MDLLFGTQGIPRSTKVPSLVSGIERVKELGLDCMEIKFVQPTMMSETSAGLVAETAERLGVILSAHAPYFINLNEPKQRDREFSRQKLVETAHIAALMGARSLTFHAAFI